MWTVRLDSLYSQYVALEDGTIGPISVNPLQIQDQFASTYINKGNFFDKANNGSSLYQIFVPFTEGADMTNFSYRIMVDGTQYGPVGKTLPFEFDPTSPAINDVQSEPVRPIDLISPITMTGPSTANADSSITVNFETTPGVSYIYLEQVHGMLPLVKVPVTNGTGSFKVLTLGMSSGDEIEVKAGFRKWNHVSSYTKTIS
jgi:hypothetical protein